MKTVEEMKIAKRNLEKALLMEIQEFEADYGVLIAAVHTETSRELGGKERTFFVSTGIVI